MNAFLTTTSAVIALAVTTFGQAGSIDLTFDPGTGANDDLYASSVQSDGKIIIGGYFGSYDGIVRNRIARLNADGTIDSSFDPGTGADDSVETISIQNDGKIIIGGYFWFYDGISSSRVARLHADGTLDYSFDPGTGADDAVWTTSIQSDGKIIIGGQFSFYNGTARNYVARLNADGTLDGSFNLGSGADWTVYTTSIQSDGKIIIGGEFTTYNGIARNHITRLNVDGSLDLTFNPGTGADNAVTTTSIQSDGKIIIGGVFTTCNGSARNRIARLNVDGTLDTTFNPGTGASSDVYTTSVQNDGKIIIGGEFTVYNGTSRNRIARLNVDGTLDPAFDPGTGADEIIWTTSIQSDGKIIIGGAFTSYNGTGRNRVARISGGTSTGLSFFSDSTSVMVYLDPATDMIWVKGSGINAITVYSSLGQRLVVQQQRTDHGFLLNVGDLPTGKYFVHATSALQTQTTSFVVLQ